MTLYRVGHGAGGADVLDMAHEHHDASLMGHVLYTPHSVQLLFYLEFREHERHSRPVRHRLC